MKKELAQTVMAMCHHGYLELEGGQLMIEFVVRQCCPQPDPQVRYLNWDGQVHYNSVPHNSI